MHVTTGARLIIACTLSVCLFSRSSFGSLQLFRKHRTHPKARTKFLKFEKCFESMGLLPGVSIVTCATFCLSSLLVLSSSCSLGSCGGHVDSSHCIILGPSTHTLLFASSVTDNPLVGRSAGFMSPGMCLHCCGLEDL